MASELVRKLAAGGTVEEIGGKAHQIALLYRSGFRVAPGFVVLTRAFDLFREANGVRFLAGSEVPADLRLPDSIDVEARAAFAKEVGRDSTAVVRSSAIHEDAPDASFAGVFASKGNVRVETLPDAVRDVFVSVSYPEVADYAARHGWTAESVKMAVLVQRQIEPWLSGVCFTRNPVTGERNLMVEFVEGPSQELLAGNVPPQGRLEFDEDLNEVSTSNASDEQRRAIAWVAGNARSIERVCGAPQDVEWAIDARGSIFILQSREITALPPAVEAQGPPESGAAQGVGLSVGEGIGPAKKVQPEMEPADLDRLVGSGDVVLAHTLRIDHLGLVAKASGVITADASMLSHVAIRTRELGVPCVGGITDVLTRFREGELLRVDGRGGLVSPEAAGRPAPPTPSQATPTYYDPDRVESLTAGDRTILYEPYLGGATVFLRRMGSTQERQAARDALSDQLGISSDAVRFDDQAEWEWGNSPSVVYSQYETVQALRADPEAAALLATGVDLLDRGEVGGLGQLIGEVDGLATAAIERGESKLRDYAATTNPEYVEEAAAAIGRARRLSGDLVGIALIDVFGSRALDHMAAQLAPAGLSVGDVLALATRDSSTQGDAEPPLETSQQRSALDSAVALARLLTAAKNRRLDVESTSDNSVLDLINQLCELGFEDVVARYGW